jgi:hypothetical protein
MRRRAVRLALVPAVVAVLLGALALHDRPPVAPGAWLAAAGLEARWETVGGHRLRYVRTGRGPAVVLRRSARSSTTTPSSPPSASGSTWPARAGPARSPRTAQNGSFPRRTVRPS